MLLKLTKNRNKTGYTDQHHKYIDEVEAKRLVSRGLALVIEDKRRK